MIMEGFVLERQGNVARAVLEVWRKVGVNSHGVKSDGAGAAAGRRYASSLARAPVVERSQASCLQMQMRFTASSEMRPEAAGTAFRFGFG